jgi:hypothetical protein
LSHLSRQADAIDSIIATQHPALPLRRHRKAGGTLSAQFFTPALLVFVWLHNQFSEATFDSQSCGVPVSGAIKETKDMSQPKSKLSRRTLFAGAGTAGAIAAAASLVPGVVQENAAQPLSKEPPEKGGGYQLTEHVKRYYKSALI